MTSYLNNVEIQANAAIVQSNTSAAALSLANISTNVIAIKEDMALTRAYISTFAANLAAFTFTGNDLNVT